MRWLIMVAGVLTGLLFVGGPDADDGRLYKETWDLGHVVLFALLVVLALKLPRLQRLPVGSLILLCAVIAPAVGLAIEWLQLLVGRDFEYKDVLADTVGAFCGLALHCVWQPGFSRWVRGVGLAGLLLLTAFALRYIVMVMIDNTYMRDEFPVLADFETPFELSRWDSNLAQLSLTQEPVRYGHKSLRVDFLAGEYPDITLQEFLSDWRDFKSIRFSLFSSLNQPIQMELKIYDRQHAASRYDYEDRFNRELIINPGWNDIEVSMKDVQRAPDSREMDLAHMAALSVFVDELRQPAVFYFDALRLSSKESSGE